MFIKSVYQLSFSVVLLSSFIGCGSNGNNSKTFSLTIPSEKSIVENSDQQVIMPITTNQSGEYSYKISGTDKSYFTIDSDNNLKFNESPDYEQKNIFNIIIEVYSGDELKTSKTVVIKVKDDPSDNTDATAPEFTTQSPLHVDENKLFIANIVASERSGIKYSINGGDDSDRLLIDERSGKLTFNHFTPDYEQPSDKNRDNHYEVELKIEDNSSNSKTKSFTIIVDDIADTGSESSAKVLKTGLNDAPNNASGFGDPRTVNSEGNGVVSVGNNGLYWEDTAHIDAEVTFDEAASYCASLTLGGRNWRVPSRKELFELVDYGKYPTMLDDNIVHKNNGDFWTKSTLLEGRVYNGQNFEVSDKGWYMSFKFGDDDFEEKTKKLHVRCVSGGTVFSNSQNFDEKNGYIEDSLTGLKWENNDLEIGKHLSWNEAKERCENLPGGIWRLPNINELHTLMPENGMDVLIYTKLQEELSIGPFWSSSTVPYNTQQAFYIENREYADPGCNDDDDQTICRYGDTQNNAVENKENNGSIRSICVSGGHL